MQKTVETLWNISCTGCSACMQICPKGCIEMKADSEGFLVPHVNIEKCVNCGLCLNRCPQNNDVSLSLPLECYGAKHKDAEIIKQSSSGGIFTLLSEEVLKRGGVVFGCVFEKNASNRLAAIHTVAHNQNELAGMRGSKYVQSDTALTYSEAQSYLEQDKWVLYTGTPCEIAGLKAFVNKEYETLLTCDIICHGVPSPLLFDKYIEFCEQKNNGKILDYQFRNKTKGWGMYYYYYSYKNNSNNKIRIKKGARDRDGYFTAFSRSDTYRECCYKCKYSQINRIADFTIGDYFAVDIQHPKFSSDAGVSCVLVNTPKAIDMLSKLHNDSEWLSVTIGEITKYSANLKKSTERPSNRDMAYSRINDPAKTLFNQDPYKVSIKGQLSATIKENLPLSIRKKLRNHIYKKTEN